MPEGGEGSGWMVGGLLNARMQERHTHLCSHGHTLLVLRRDMPAMCKHAALARD
jgi:hypothetical protein